MTTVQKLTYEQFQEQYGQQDRVFEFWYGEAREKAVPTIIHGLLQVIIAELLRAAGFLAASEVELRIEPEAHPRPDIIAIKGKVPTMPYPTTGWDVVVEIVSEDDLYPRVRERCRKYQEWGFGRVYVVDPSDRSVVEWKNGALIPVSELSGVPVAQIWQELDKQFS